MHLVAHPDAKIFVAAYPVVLSCVDDLIEFKNVPLDNEIRDAFAQRVRLQLDVAQMRELHNDTPEGAAAIQAMIHLANRMIDHIAARRMVLTFHRCGEYSAELTENVLNGMIEKTLVELYRNEPNTRVHRWPDMRIMARIGTANFTRMMGAPAHVEPAAIIPFARRE